MIGGGEGEAAERGGRAAPLRCVAYSTADLPPEAQFAGWRAMCLPLVEMLPPPAGAQGYRAAAKVWQVGRFGVSEVSAAAGAFRRTAAMIRADGVDHWILNVVLRGNVRLHTAGRTFALPPGVPVLYGFGAPFRGARGDLAWLGLFIPRGAIPRRAAAAARPGLVAGPLGRLLAGALTRLVARLPELTVAEEARIELAIGALLDNCLADGLEPSAAKPVHPAAGQGSGARRRAQAAAPESLTPGPGLAAALRRR